MFFAGLDDQSDLEGKDRENLLLPSNQIKLINELLSMGKRVCLILFGGSIVELPFVNSVQAILMMYLPGQGGGEACYRLIYGEVNPSGHLDESWPEAYTDVPFGRNMENQLEIFIRKVYLLDIDTILRHI